MSGVLREDEALITRLEVNEDLNPEIERDASEFHGVTVHHGSRSVGLYVEDDTITAYPKNILIELRGSNTVEGFDDDHSGAIHELAGLTDDRYAHNLLAIDEHAAQFEVVAQLKARETLNELNALIDAITPDVERTFSPTINQDAVLSIGGLILNRGEERAHQLVNYLNEQIQAIQTNKPWVLAHGPQGSIAAQLVELKAELVFARPVIRPIVLTASRERALLPADSRLGRDWIVFEHKPYDI